MTERKVEAMDVVNALARFVIVLEPHVDPAARHEAATFLAYMLDKWMNGSRGNDVESLRAALRRLPTEDLKQMLNQYDGSGAAGKD